MARIRSIHPKILTDEAFMALTVNAPLAIALLIGLWMEADDGGVFEWKPLTLKARILPVAAQDITELLTVLCDGNFVRRFEIENKSFGVVRNFVKYQRPKKPSDIYPSSTESRAYAGFDNGKRPHSGTGRPPSSDNGKPVPGEFVTGSVIPPQREEEGGRREDNPPLPITAEVGGEGDFEEGEGLFKTVWEGFPTRKTESEPKARQAFSAIPIAEQRQFAACIAQIAEHIRSEKLTNPHSLANFIAERRFKGFATGPPCAKRQFRHQQESPQGRAFDDDYKRRTGRGVPWVNGYWFFETEWPAKASETAA